MATTTHHSGDNEKMVDRAQKRRELTKFIRTYTYKLTHID